MQAPPPIVRKALWFLDEKGRPYRVCRRKHKEGVACDRPFHAVPASAIWSGEVDLAGELREAAREARKAHRRALRTWQRRKNLLAATHAAPAFAGYLESEREKHLKARPVLTFSIGKERVTQQ